MSQGSWKYGRRHPVCGDCEREFSDGEAHFSFLHVGEEAELERIDLCVQCWDARSEEQPELWWRARRQVSERKGLAVDMEALEAIFHQLAQKDGDRHRELRYVLCLLLMRKRRLLLNRAVVAKGREAMLVRRPRRKENIEVEVFDLAAERMDEIRDGLQRLFEGEPLEAPRPSGEAEDGEAGEIDGVEAGPETETAGSDEPAESEAAAVSASAAGDDAAAPVDTDDAARD